MSTDASRKRITADVASSWRGGTGISLAAGASGFGTAVVMETTTTLRRRRTATLLAGSRSLRRLDPYQSRLRHDKQQRQADQVQQLSPSRKLSSLDIVVTQLLSDELRLTLLKRYSHLVIIARDSIYAIARICDRNSVRTSVRTSGRPSHG